jgi:hypothetical protein
VEGGLDDYSPTPFIKLERSGNYAFSPATSESQWPPRSAGCTFFYFTDNIVTYYVMAKEASRIPSLPAIVTAYKELEADLGCHLEPVHVLGTTIILQTTDGLSRGVWGTALHEQVSQQSIQSAIFSPLPFDTDMGDWVRNKAHIPVNMPWRYRRWYRPWRFHDDCDRLTVWTPPPEIAPQLLHFLLLVYVEAPLTTACLILIPRILQRRWLQRRWQNMSRIVREIGVYQHKDCPFVCHSPLTITLVLLLIPFHICQTPDVPRLDPSPMPPAKQFHEASKTLLRWMLEEFEA